MTTTLDRLRAAITDPARLAPASRTFGLRVTAVEAGEVRADLPGGRDPALGLLALADFVLGAAIGTALPAGRRVGTLTLRAAVLADPPPGSLTAVGRLDDVRDGSGIARAEIRAGDGLVALLGTRCAVLPAAGHPVPPAIPATWAPGTADPALANMGGTVQGGVLAAALARALDADGAGSDLDVTYLRPLAADGRPFTVTTSPMHGGRRWRAGRAELLDADGRPVAVATGSRWSESSTICHDHAP